MKFHLMKGEKLKLCTANESTITSIVIEQELELIHLSLLCHADKNQLTQLLVYWTIIALN